MFFQKQEQAHIKQAAIDASLARVLQARAKERVSREQSRRLKRIEETAAHLEMEARLAVEKAAAQKAAAAARLQASVDEAKAKADKARAEAEAKKKMELAASAQKRAAREVAEREKRQHAESMLLQRSYDTEQKLEADAELWKGHTGMVNCQCLGCQRDRAEEMELISARRAAGDQARDSTRDAAEASKRRVEARLKLSASLTKTEALAEGMTANDFALMDADGDGTLTRAEFDAWNKGEHRLSGISAASGPTGFSNVGQADGEATFGVVSVEDEIYEPSDLEDDEEFGFPP